MRLSFVPGRLTCLEMVQLLVVRLETLVLLGSFVAGMPRPIDLAYKTDYDWLSWKQQHNQAYEGELLELERYILWQSNRALVNAHNEYASLFGYTLELNKFADLVSG